MKISRVSVKSVLTRSSGYLKSVCSHSLQPYRGCPLGTTLCGVGCYVQHNIYVTQGRDWGQFLDVRLNAADAYRATFERERSWARRSCERFSIFFSSATEPFPAQERRFGVSRSILEAMLDRPPDALIVQTHSHLVTEAAELLVSLSKLCELRVHLSIETDRDRIPGLPPPASSVEARFQAAEKLKGAGLRVVITVSPLLPIADPECFFERIARCADAVVLDHFLGGDGSVGGQRTRRTPLPDAMAALEPESLTLAYRDRMGQVAERFLPGRVGYHIDGFAGRFERPE